MQKSASFSSKMTRLFVLIQTHFCYIQQKKAHTHETREFQTSPIAIDATTAVKLWVRAEALWLFPTIDEATDAVLLRSLICGRGCVGRWLWQLLSLPMHSISIRPALQLKVHRFFQIITMRPSCPLKPAWGNSTKTSQEFFLLCIARWVCVRNRNLLEDFGCSSRYDIERQDQRQQLRYVLVLLLLYARFQTVNKRRGEGCMPQCADHCGCQGSHQENNSSYFLLRTVSALSPHRAALSAILWTYTHVSWNKRHSSAFFHLLTPHTQVCSPRPPPSHCIQYPPCRCMLGWRCTLSQTDLCWRITLSHRRRKRWERFKTRLGVQVWETCTLFAVVPARCPQLIWYYVYCTTVFVCCAINRYTYNITTTTAVVCSII